MADMTPQEQLMLELINRARMDPNGEATRYGIALNEGLAAGTISATSKQVLAGSSALAAAADNHSSWMLTNNTFSHQENGGTGFTGTNPNDRMAYAGYDPISWWGENISYDSRSQPMTDALLTQLILEQHQSLFVDSGTNGRGHRLNMLNDNFQEAGIGQKSGQFQSLNTSMVTQNFGRSGSQVFITGVVYNDTVIKDDFFSVGEQTVGRGVSSGAVTDTTGAGGGYELSYSSGGAKSVTFNLTTGNVTVDVALGSINAKLDVVNGKEVWSNTGIALVSNNVGELHALGIDAIDLHAGAGNQRLYGNSANNILDGGDGTDVAVYNGAFADFNISRNADGSYQVQDRTGAEGTDTIVNIEKLQFSDRLYVVGRGADIVGTNKADRLRGTELGELIKGLNGNDKLHGKGGDDILNGGRGSDDLYGGAGADTFVFTSRGGHDNIYDFSHKQGDKIDLSGVQSISGYHDLIKHHISFDEFKGVLISVNHGNDLWVEDMDGRHMHRSDFIF